MGHPTPTPLFEATSNETRQKQKKRKEKREKHVFENFQNVHLTSPLKKSLDPRL